MGWWVVVGGVGEQTHLHVKPNSFELERTVVVAIETFVELSDSTRDNFDWDTFDAPREGNNDLTNSAALTSFILSTSSL